MNVMVFDTVKVLWKLPKKVVQQYYFDYYLIPARPPKILKKR